MAEKLSQEQQKQQINNAYDLLSQVSRKGWESAYEELKQDENYTISQTLFNCKLVLDTLHIDLPEELHSAFLSQTKYRHTEGVTSVNILFALSTVQLNRYQELLDELPPDLQPQSS